MGWIQRVIMEVMPDELESTLFMYAKNKKF